MGLAAVALAVVATGGCTFTTQQQTNTYYMPSDGVEALLGPDVVVTSVLVVAEDQESPGTLIARIVNSGTEPISVQVLSDEADIDLDVTVNPGEMYAVGPEGDQEVLIDPLPVVPGQSIPMTAVLEGGEIVEDMLVPVLDSSLREYEELVPTADPTASL